MSAEPAPAHENQLKDIISEIIEAGGEITEQQELDMQRIISEAEGLLEMVREITELNNQVYISKKWIEARQAHKRTCERLAGMIREQLPRAFAKDKQGGKLVSPVKDPEDPLRKVSYVSPSKTPGPVDPNDSELVEVHSVSGYTEEQMEASNIPATFFVPHTVYKLNLELIGEYLDHGQKVGAARRLPRKSGVRISDPFDLQKAEDRKKEAERKKAREYKGGEKG